jgi:hypothetical protein
VLAASIRMSAEQWGFMGEILLQGLESERLGEGVTEIIVR